MSAFTAIIRGLTSKVAKAGQSELVSVPGLNKNGGVIINPVLIEDQGLQAQTLAAQILYVSIVGPINFTVHLKQGVNNGSQPNQFGANGLVPINSLHTAGFNVASPYATPVTPGQSFIVPPLCSVWVSSLWEGHKFTAYFLNYRDTQYPPTVIPSDFPPVGLTGLTEVIPSYLYQEYSDDDDLQAFVTSQNILQQDYIDTFNALNLPIYTGDIISGALLDWVGNGIYGYPRPIVSRGHLTSEGPVNTYGPNYPVSINGIRKLQIKDVAISDDDFYKRALTWHYNKGDGKYFNIRWLKRRVMRFLIGVNGTSPPIETTDQISVSFGPDYNATIRFVTGKRTVTGGAIVNVLGCNLLIPINSITSTYEKYPEMPYVDVFQAALQGGALEVPFQMRFTCVIG